MKTRFLIPAGIALIGLGWLISQTSSIATLEKQNTDLRQRIASRQARPPSTGNETGRPPRQTAQSDAEKAKEPIDWKALASQATQMMNGGATDTRLILRLRQRLKAMSAEELLDAIDEISALDIDPQSKQFLSQTVVGPLIDKDPRLALERLGDRIRTESEGMFGWQLSNALRKWADKDPSAAGQWFDARIAAGLFDSKSLDGKSIVRQQFEGAFLSVLFAKDPEQAGSRLASFPPDQRKAMLDHHEVSGVKKEHQAAYAKIIREQIPPDQQADVLARPAARLSLQGYAEAGEYLDRIRATPGERETAIGEVAKYRIEVLSNVEKITTSQIDEMRDWADSQVPGSADRATGQAVAQLANHHSMSRKSTYEETSGLALHYFEKTGNDDVLISFLDSWSARQNTEISRPIAEKIRDPKRREEILSRLK